MRLDGIDSAVLQLDLVHRRVHALQEAHIAVQDLDLGVAGAQEGVLFKAQVPHRAKVAKEARVLEGVSVHNYVVHVRDIQPEITCLGGEGRGELVGYCCSLGLLIFGGSSRDRQSDRETDRYII